MALSTKAIFHDIKALGSWTFYVLVIARASIDVYRPFLDQLLIAGVLLFILAFLIPHDGHIARALAAAVFTSLFYNTLHFTLFVALIILALIAISFKISEKRKIVYGVGCGIAVSIVAYLITGIYL